MEFFKWSKDVVSIVPIENGHVSAMDYHGNPQPSFSEVMTHILGV